MALSRGLTRLLAVTCGVTIANVYFAQPLPHTIVRGLGTGQATAGFIVTATQLGFAAGLLLSRTFAGVISSLLGWRGVYAVAAGLMAVTAFVMSRVLPATGREVGTGFAAQMRAVLRLAASEPVLRWRALIGAAQFAAFSCFWTTVTFLLSGPPFGYSQAEIGLFALVGVAGALCVLPGGRLLDRHRHLRRPATGAAVAYGRYGWHGACGVAAGFCGIALLGWSATCHHERTGDRMRLGPGAHHPRMPR